MPNLMRPLAAALFVLGAGVLPRALATQEDVAGTYELVVCRSACEPADVEGQAERIRLSLYAEPLFTTGPLAGRRPERYEMFPHLWDTPERANACFSMAYDPEGTFIGIDPRAITAWSADTAGTLAFSLYRSPDAGSEVNVRRTADGLVGEVRDWSVMGARASSRSLYVAARRVGPPDPRVCGIQPRT